jgi:hypothetical protein
VDLTFIEGISAVLAGIIVFCGSVWLLLTMLMGGRLAYFVTASVALGFVLIMGIVWSLPATNPLGPVGKLPEWDPMAIGTDASDLNFAAASQYPGGPWRAVDQQDDAELAKAAELGTAATDLLAAAIEQGRVPDAADDNTPNAETVRLVEQGGTEYGAVRIEPPEGGQAPSVIALLRYDPGNPLGQARMITAGTFLLLVAHLVALARSEKRAQRAREASPA